MIVVIWRITWVTDIVQSLPPFHLQPLDLRNKAFDVPAGVLSIKMRMHGVIHGLKLHHGCAKPLTLKPARAVLHDKLLSKCNISLKWIRCFPCSRCPAWRRGRAAGSIPRRAGSARSRSRALQGRCERARRVRAGS